MATPNGELVLTNGKIYMGAYDISADLYKLDVSTAPDMQDNTTFGASYRTKQAGLSTAKVAIEGFSKFNATDVNAIDGRLYTNLSAVDIPFSFAADGGDAGEDGFFMKAMLGKYNFGGSIGQMAKFTTNAEATGAGVQLVKGTIFEDGKTSRVAAGNSSVYTLGALSATQNLYAVLHVLAFVGTNVTFKVRSAVTSFATITDRISFTAATGVTSQYATPVAGAITDTFWRVDWTGTFTSFSAVVIVGIQ